MSATYDFSGKKVIVTGASEGIGRDVAVSLANAGATVFAVARNKDRLEQLGNEFSSVHPIVCDMGASYETIESAVSACLPVDCLVNNAGIAVTEPFLDAKPDSFDKTMSVNVRGALFMSQIVVKSMIANRVRNGSIVHVSSVASTLGLPIHVNYCMSKAAMDAMARVMAVELGEHGIRVNCVNPTAVMTAMGKSVWGDPQKAKPLLDRIPMGHFAEMSDVTKTVLFLLSDQSRMTTGHALPVDGGQWAS